MGLALWTLNLKARDLNFFLNMRQVKMFRCAKTTIN